MATHIFPTSVTIEPDRDEWVAVGHGTYEDSSVLAGQSRWCPLDWFPTKEEACKAYPKGVVKDCQAPRSTAMVPSCPPSDFSEADAGERWDEE